jgi:hypothetical protein
MALIWKKHVHHVLAAGEPIPCSMAMTQEVIDWSYRFHIFLAEKFTA